MHSIDTIARAQRNSVRASAVGKPYPIFRASEVDELFRDFPTGIPAIPDGGVDGWHRAEGIVVRDQLEIEQAKDMLRDWVERSHLKDRHVGLAIVGATPTTFTIGAFTRDKVPFNVTKPRLTNEEFLDGEDPRQPILLP